MFDRSGDVRLAISVIEDITEIKQTARRVLVDQGVDGLALRAVARSAPLPTTIDSRLPHRYPREVESAVYFACLEALQNAGKHAAGATGVRISLSGNGRLRFDVRDDGDPVDDT